MKVLINRFFLGIKSVVEYVRVKATFCFITKKAYFKRKEVDVIVSGTTFPARINHFENCLKSLLLQTVRPKKIIIYLSRDEFPLGVSAKLEIFKKFNVEFHFVEGNARSYKKLIYAMRAYPKNSIITVDDDVYYPSTWLEKMYDTHVEFSEDIIFYRGHLINFNSDGLPIDYNKMLYLSTSGLTENVRFLPTGVCGILYPPDSLYRDYDALDKIKKLAPTADDIWFKAMGVLHKRRFRRVNPYNVLYPPVLGSQRFSLKKVNVSDGTSRNDQQLKNTFDEYQLWEEMHEK